MAENKDASTAENCNPSASFRMTVAGIKKKFPRVENVSTSTLSEWMNSCGVDEEQKAGASARDVGKNRKLVLFDVRPLEEYNVSHLPSAIRLDPDVQDMEHVKSVIQEQVEKDGISRTGEDYQPVTAVMYCSVGYRSSAMAGRVYKALCDQRNNTSADNSLTDLKVYNLQGSIFQWANENKPLVDSSDQPTQYVHPYSRLWGLLIDKNRWKWADSKQ
ncbi:uncharacterized protein [Amphiura filiformis]|uniref:uncharacterized protein n=1 Tax=Amphiura filiformis TaxID=82378 RepID=UPI003B21FD52